MQRLTDQLACLLGTSCHESDPNHLSACEYLEVSKPVIADGTETISYAPCCFPQRDLSKACDTLQTSDNCFEHCRSSPNTFLHEHALPQGLECVCFSDSPCTDTSFDAGGCASPTSVFAEPRHQSFVFHSALPPPFICGGAVCQKVHTRAQVDHALSTISPPGFHLRKLCAPGKTSTALGARTLSVPAALRWPAFCFALSSLVLRRIIGSIKRFASLSPLGLKGRTCPPLPVRSACALRALLPRRLILF